MKTFYLRFSMSPSAVPVQMSLASPKPGAEDGTAARWRQIKNYLHEASEIWGQLELLQQGPGLVQSWIGTKTSFPRG